MSTESTTTPREGRENHENYYNFSHHSRTANVIYKSPICDECQSQSAKVFGPSMNTCSTRRSQQYTNVCASIVQFPFLWIQWLIRVYPNSSYTISSNWRYKFEIFSKLLGIKHNIVAKQPPNVTWPNWTQFGS